MEPEEAEAYLLQSEKVLGCGSWAPVWAGNTRHWHAGC
jgi:predicted N-formylglutamate amidohydrolase